MSVARALADFLCRTQPSALPDEAVKHASMLVASTLASAAMGSRIRSAAIIRELARERGGALEATVWFGRGLKLPIADTARTNVLMSEAAASDDSDLRTTMHCGAPLVAASLAVAEREGASGEDLLASIVLGYEAAGRLHDGIPLFRKRGFHGSTLTIFAATVAAGRLLRLDPGQMSQAICLAATSAGGLSAAANTSVAREYNGGQSVMNGIEAARAARCGYTAEEAILEMKGGFFECYGCEDGQAAGRAALDDLGSSWDIVTDLAVKLMPGGHPYHAFAQAAASAARDGAVRPDQVETIFVSRPGMTSLQGPLHPTDLVQMAHSAAYFLAAAIADGAFTWGHAAPGKIADPMIHRLIDRVQVGPPPSEDAARYRRGATVTIQTTDGGSFTSTVYAPNGSAMLGLNWADIDAKYRTLMPYSGLPADEIERALDLIHRLRDLGTIRPLTQTLRA